MKNYVILLSPEIDGDNLYSVATAEVCDGDTLKLERCYDLLDCDLIDIHVISELEDELLLIFDDEFLLKHPPVPNVLASQLDQQVICGSALLCRSGADGSCIPFSAAEANLIVTLLKRFQRCTSATLSREDE